ncbi:MAG: DUF1552 domain-containing protein [Rhodospirillaceae bacterium]
MNPHMNRRRVLRGMMGGAAVSVGLPFLDCFLNASGTALADGNKLPLCFTSWFQGLGFGPGFWEPKTVGPGYEMALHLRALAPIKDKVNIYSGMKVYLDGHPAVAHQGGAQGFLQGAVGDNSKPSIDQIVADAIGKSTRFRSLEVSCDGQPESYSRRSATALNPSEVSPVKLYQRLFGPDFKDPNAADFTPDPRVMVEASVLSHVKGEREVLAKKLGAADRVRLDEYFTSLREMEQRLNLELQKPAPLAGCKVPEKVAEEAPLGLVIDSAMANHALFAKLLAHAFACGQTQVASVNLGGATSNLRKAGEQQTFHMYTHEEPVDPVLGYQVNVEWFSNKSMEALLQYIRTLQSIREGDGTLFDRTLTMYSTDSGYARMHSCENMPAITIGNAGGRMKTGIHVAAKGDTVVRVGLTVMQTLGLNVGTWGAESNMTSKPFSEVMV